MNSTQPENNDRFLPPQPWEEGDSVYDYTQVCHSCGGSFEDGMFEATGEYICLDCHTSLIDTAHEVLSD